MLPTPLVINKASHLLNPLWGCTSLLRTSLCFMRRSIHQTGTCAPDGAKDMNAVPLSTIARQRAKFRIRNWLPLVDALRTMLLTLPPEVRETIVDLRLGGRPGFPFPA